MERKNDTLYLIVFLIFAMLIGFGGAYMLVLPNEISYMLTATMLTLCIYCMILLIYYTYKKHTIYKTYRSYLARGSYSEVVKSIDSDSKEMNTLWEFKMLALFHSGNTVEFQRLYRSYMNEINECATLERYQLCLLHDLLLAVESPNKPVRFLKHTNSTRHNYTKSIDYQLYQNIYMGLKEYYQPQYNLVKVYFEKFLQQAQNISKPLSFHLYYLMTITMFESKHPLCEPYINRTQSYIYDEVSLQLVNTNILQGTSSVQKGNGDQEPMDRQREGNNFLNDMNAKSFDASYDMEETGFRTLAKSEDGFVKKRHASEFQSDFDALNATVQNNNSFNLYEDHDYGDIAPRQRPVRDMQAAPIQEDVNMDLDPTWFARSALKDDEPIVQANYSMRNPRMQENQNQGQEPMRSRYQSNQMQQDPFVGSPSYQDIPVTPTYPNSVQAPLEEPAFMDSRTYMDTTRQEPQDRRQQRSTMQSRNPMMNQAVPAQQTPQMRQQPMQQRFPNQMAQQPVQEQMNQVSNPQMQQRMQNSTMMQQNMANTPQDRFSRFQQGSTPRETMHENIEQPMVKETPDKRRFSRKEKKNNKQDPFGFDNPNAMGKDPFLHENAHQHDQSQQFQRKEATHQQTRTKQTKQKSSPVAQSYSSYVKRNMVIAGMTLLNGAVISIASSSFVYMQFFNKYPINSDSIAEIVLLASLVAILMTYLIAGIHTGWTILQKPIANWSMVAKCLTSPFLLIASLLIGAVSEIPYMIFASIKANSEKATQ